MCEREKKGRKKEGGDDGREWGRRTKDFVGKKRIYADTCGSSDIAAIGGAYEFTKSASANLRQKDDTYNTAVGGFFSGAVMGLKGA